MNVCLEILKNILKIISIVFFLEEFCLLKRDLYKYIIIYIVLCIIYWLKYYLYCVI